MVGESERDARMAGGANALCCFVVTQHAFLAARSSPGRIPIWCFLSAKGKRLISEAWRHAGLLSKLLCKLASL